MTPGARVQAAIGILDNILQGEAAERELTRWTRGNRYAGSKDRAAVRDHVFDALRRLRSAAWAGGAGDVALPAMDGRAVMAGLLRLGGRDPAAFFTGEGYAPEPLSEPPADPGPAPEAVALDIPDWLLPLLRRSLGAETDAVLAALRDRAPVTLRVNVARAGLAEVAAMLAETGIASAPHPVAPTALVLEGAPRGLTALPAFRDGLFELQDAGSQALVDRVPLEAGARILDLCAGGGGKTLALSARGAGPIFAHDVEPGRMRDLPARAERAGAQVAILDDPKEAAPFDGVVVDVPCSGSGSWRRTPEAKWRLTPERLADLLAMQSAILDRAVALTRPGGWIAYMTCSFLAEENAAQADDACSKHGGLSVEDRWNCTPLDGCDGFHLSLLRRA